MIKIHYIDHEFAISDLDNMAWQKAFEVMVDTYWSGKKAPVGRQFSARLLWSDAALYVRFEASQNEPLVINTDPQLQGKTVGLWERDVCEIFVAPDPASPAQYFEFEIAPTGEWLDLGIEITPEGRRTRWSFNSGMETAAEVRQDTILLALRVSFGALGKRPQAGDVWLGNLFRCVGAGPARGYLAWQPTGTERPSFHVPTAFGRFSFVD